MKGLLKTMLFYSQVSRSVVREVPGREEVSLSGGLARPVKYSGDHRRDTCPRFKGWFSGTSSLSFWFVERPRESSWNDGEKSRRSAWINEGRRGKINLLAAALFTRAAPSDTSRAAIRSGLCVILLSNGLGEPAGRDCDARAGDSRVNCHGNLERFA